MPLSRHYKERDRDMMILTRRAYDPDAEAYTYVSPLKRAALGLKAAQKPTTPTPTLRRK